MNTPFLSKALDVYDYQKVDFLKFVEPFAFDEDQLKDSLEFLQKKYAYREDVLSIEGGDFATIRCNSELKKFQKDNITLNVGKNLYSKELESQLIGLNVNDCKILHVGETAVEVEVLKIERNVLPELTDEFINKTFVELSNYEDLIRWYEKDQKENYLKQQSENIAEEICKEVIAKSIFDIDENERLQAREQGRSIVEEMWIFNGIPLDAMSDEQAMELLGYPSAQAYTDWFMDLNEQGLYQSLLGYELLKERNEIPDRSQYEKMVSKYCEEEGKTAEEMKEIYTFSAFMKQTCAEKHNEVLKDYVYKKLKEAIK